MSNAFIQLDDLHCTFMIKDGFFGGVKPLHAVRGISLNIAKGEVLAIVGESGCGKTTLAKMLLGLQTPTSGSVTLDGQPIAQFSRREFARRVQPVYQDPYSSLNPRKTIEAIIGLPLLVQGMGDAASRRREVASVMDMVGLPPHLAQAYPGQLSGGQRQRVAIARALITKPEVLVCDEPTSALDVSVQAQILNLLTDLRRDLQLTYVFITHDLAVVEQVADRVAVMYLGQMVEQGLTENVLSSPAHPYTQALLQSVLTVDPSLGLPDLAMGNTLANPMDITVGCPYYSRCAEGQPQCQQKPVSLTGNAAHQSACLVHPIQLPVAA